MALKMMSELPARNGTRMFSACEPQLGPSPPHLYLWVHFACWKWVWLLFGLNVTRRLVCKT